MTDLQCLICGSQSVVIIGKRTDFHSIEYYSPYVEEIGLFDRNIGKCQRCGFAFINPMYNEDDFEKLYTPIGYDEFAKGQGALYTKERFDGLAPTWLDHFYKLGIGEWRHSFIDRYGRPPKMLDIGCGYGRILKLFDMMGFEVQGIDVHDTAVEYVKSNMGYPIKKINLFDLSPTAKFDFLVLNHFVEHVPDPKVLITKVKDLLSEDGLLFIETPWADDGGHYDHRYRDIYHTLFFNHLSLLLMGLHSGLSVNRTQRTNYSGYGQYHKNIQVLYSISNQHDLSSSDISSLAAMFNSLEREHSDMFNKCAQQEDYPERLQAIEASLSWRVMKAVRRFVHIFMR